ncbi:MAG TPA: PAAR-like protein [Flavobacterium sp.]
MTTKEIGGTTLEKNTFGNCTKMGNPPPPCKPMITEWKDFYKDVTLSNGGNTILENSKAVCAIAGTPCIEIIDHGQRAEASTQNFKNANKEVHKQINPLVSPEDMYKKKYNSNGIKLG